MRLFYFCVAALAASVSSFAQTTVPATPSLAAGAQFKGLQFDWESVAGATSYQLEYRAHQGGAFVPQGGALLASATSTRFTFPLHLFDWTYARYRLAACNSAGCSRSPEVSVSLLRRDAVGYFKASRRSSGLYFGDDVALSPDGYNFVAAAPGDSILASPHSLPGGALYVFRRASNGVWAQRARLEPTVPPFIEGTNVMQVAISASGNTIALGMPNYWHQEFDANAGEVQVFHWNGTSWSRTRIPRVASESFGESVALSDSGFTLVVGHSYRSQVAIYKLIGGVWQNVRNIPNSADGNEHCGSPSALSRDGSTLAQFCSIPASDASAGSHFIRAWSGNNWTAHTDMPMEMSAGAPNGFYVGAVATDRSGDTIAAQIYVSDGIVPTDGPSQVNVFKRSGGVYSQVATLTPGPWRTPSQRRFYGLRIAVAGDGATIAVDDSWDNGLGTGPRAAPLISGEARTGAVYIYRLTNGWKLANMVKPDNPVNDYRVFGRALALSDSGRTLLAGDAGDASDAVGIGGDWHSTGAGGSGAAWMY